MAPDLRPGTAAQAPECLACLPDPLTERPEALPLREEGQESLFFPQTRLTRSLQLLAFFTAGMLVGLVVAFRF